MVLHSCNLLHFSQMRFVHFSLCFRCLQLCLSLCFFNNLCVFVYFQFLVFYLFHFEFCIPLACCVCVNLIVFMSDVGLGWVVFCVCALRMCLCDGVCVVLVVFRLVWKCLTLFNFELRLSSSNHHIVVKCFFGDFRDMEMYRCQS